MCQNIGLSFGCVKYMGSWNAPNGSYHNIRLVYFVCYYMAIGGGGIS